MIEHVIKHVIEHVIAHGSSCSTPKPSKAEEPLARPCMAGTPALGASLVPLGTRRLTLDPPPPRAASPVPKGNSSMTTRANPMMLWLV